ncbi:hypothetical protein FGB62_51g03 [Gracilaria domingensis]|nr:hypothetical protein FGB62_51g03 [Gracilaria domingensis]
MEKVTKKLGATVAAAAKQQQKAAKERERAKLAKEKANQRETACKLKQRQDFQGRIAKICPRKHCALTKKARREMSSVTQCRYDSIVRNIGGLVGGIVCDVVGLVVVHN